MDKQAKTERILIRLSPEELRALDEVAEQEDRTRADLIRHWIRQAQEKEADWAVLKALVRDDVLTSKQ